MKEQALQPKYTPRWVVVIINIVIIKLYLESSYGVNITPCQVHDH